MTIPAIPQSLHWTSHLPKAADAMPGWTTNSRSTLIDFTESPISDGDLLYLRWTGGDVAGGGLRDQFALDDISILPNPCFVPSALQASGITASSADLTWSQVLSAVSYEIRYRVVGSGAWTATMSSTSSLSVSSLESGTEYQWKVKAICSSNGSIKSSFSAKSQFSTTGAPACPEPSNLSDLQVTNTEQSLMWDPVTEAVSFEVRHRIKGAAGGWTNTPSGSNSLNLTTLQPGTTYQWRVPIHMCCERVAGVSIYVQSCLHHQWSTLMSRSGKSYGHTGGRIYRRSQLDYGTRSRFLRNSV